MDDLHSIFTLVLYIPRKLISISQKVEHEGEDYVSGRLLSELT